MSVLREKLKLDRHHRIERFGVLFFVLVLLLSVVVTSIAIKKAKDDSVTLDNRVVYTNSFKTSLTEQSGTVEGIYKNEDNTKVFVLLKFKSMSKMSTNAENYQMFLTGSSLDMKKTDLKNVPKGCIYMFGSTGYMGIYLVDTNGFQKQIFDLVVRCNSELSSKTQTASESYNGDASFTNYDQFRLYFNPGGTKCGIMECLSSDEVRPFDIYEELIVRPKELELRDTLNADLETMQTNLAVIQEYTERVARDGIVVPETPYLIAGDTITCDENGIYTLHTDRIVAKGFDFDWQNGSIRNGYLDALTGDLSYTQYFSTKNSEVDSVPFSTSKLKWYYTDGSEYSASDSMSVGIGATINNDITNLTSAWQTYYNNKKSHQTSDLKELLLLEIDAKDVEVNCTMNNSDTVLTTY